MEQMIAVGSHEAVQIGDKSYVLSVSWGPESTHVLVKLTEVTDTEHETEHDADA